MESKYRLIINGDTTYSNELVHVADYGFTKLIEMDLMEKEVSVQLLEGETLLLDGKIEFEHFFNIHHIQVYLGNDFDARVYYETDNNIRFPLYNPYGPGYNQDLEKYLVKSMEKYQIEQSELKRKLQMQ